MEPSPIHWLIPHMVRTVSIEGSSATVSGTTLSFVAAAVASGRATGANAAAVVARAANTAAFILPAQK